MVDLTNPPFTRQQGQPPMYLRDLSPEELAQWQRMRDAYEKLSKPEPVPCAS